MGRFNNVLVSSKTPGISHISHLSQSACHSVRPLVAFTICWLVGAKSVAGRKDVCPTCSSCYDLIKDREKTNLSHKDNNDSTKVNAMAT